MNFQSKKFLGYLGAVVLGLVFFFGGFAYNEAGYQTHVRTIYGSEKVVEDVGYSWKGFGRATPWKQAQTIQFTAIKRDKDGRLIEDESVTDDNIPVTDFKVVFLGNVDSVVEASTRFRVPTGDEFLKIAREYRTPDNFYRTAVIPAIKETLQSTASLMTADDYFAGARSEFGIEFQNQLTDGQYVIKRKEVRKKENRERNVAAGLTSEIEEDVSRSQFEITKEKDSNGNYIRKSQTFRLLGVEVVEARITNVEPNDIYRGRMIKVQNALADLAVARQDRLKEEESKLLVTARGEKQVEEKRQETLRDQIEKTTNSDTAKQLAIIEAEKNRETARIKEETEQLLLNAAKIEAQRIKTIADAQAYEKRVLLEADGALTQKLEAYKDVQSKWADAYARAPVPSLVMGGSNNGSTGRGSESNAFMEILTMNAAKQLAADISIRK